MLLWHGIFSQHRSLVCYSLHVEMSGVGFEQELEFSKLVENWFWASNSNAIWSTPWESLTAQPFTKSNNQNIFVQLTLIFSILRGPLGVAAAIAWSCIWVFSWVNCISRISKPANSICQVQ